MTKQKPHKRTAKAARFGPEDMDRLLRQSGILFTQRQLDQLWQYHTLLRRYNPELNMTRIHSFPNMVLKLYVDSILPGQFVQLPSPLLDLGTGPGMPGIPLKIAYPNIEIVLAETRQNRVDFLKTVIDQMQLKGISVYGHAVTAAYEQTAAGVITRAVEHVDKTLERIRGCMTSGGMAIFMKGPHCDDEIHEAQTRMKSEYRLAKDIPYRIPQTPHARRLVIFERTSASVGERKADAMQRYRVRTIESEQNNTFKDLKKLLTGKGVRKQEKAILSGSKQVNDAVEAIAGHCLAWITRSDQWPPPETLPAHAAWYQLEPKLFETLDVIGTNAPLMVVKIDPMPTWHPDDGLPGGLSLMIPFQDPENVGTVIRSAVAFGVEHIIMLAESANPFHPKAMRASGGAVLHARLMQGPSIQAIPETLPVITLSAEGTPLDQFPFPESVALLPGMEGPGLPAHLRPKAVSIPIAREVESLNAATATAIALYEWSRGK